MVVMDRELLADFLRHRRESLQPEDVGLARGARRRTTGLRREEVALLASMSTDYYARLEQQRGPQPSPPMLAAIGRGLRLTLAERDHLFRLAGHTPPRSDVRTNHVAPGMRRVLDRLDAPAMVTNDLGEVLAQNPLGVALFGDESRFKHRLIRTDHASTVGSPIPASAPYIPTRSTTNTRAPTSRCYAPPPDAIPTTRTAGR